MLVKLIEEKWNENTEELLKNVRAISFPDAIIAILTEKAFTYANNDGRPVEKVVAEVKEHMADARSTMPDFSYWPMEDGKSALVYLSNGMICTYLNEEETKWPGKVPHDAMGELLIYRAMCQEAAELDEIIALDIPEKSGKPTEE